MRRSTPGGVTSIGDEPLAEPYRADFAGRWAFNAQSNLVSVE